MNKFSKRIRTADRTCASTVNRIKMAKYQCGICFDDMNARKLKRFGLLSSCDHVFCFDCLKNWRETRFLNDRMVKCCPQCRKHSDLMVSSRRFLTGREKNQLFQKLRPNQLPQYPRVIKPPAPIQRQNERVNERVNEREREPERGEGKSGSLNQVVGVALVVLGISSLYRLFSRR